MSEISAAMVKQLREKSGAGIMDCKHALAECDGDIEKSIEYLRKKGLATAQKRAGRATKEGAVQAYIHMGGKIGVLVEVNCETDFVAKTDDFTEFVKNIAMHIAATNPVGDPSGGRVPRMSLKKRRRSTGPRHWRWENLKRWSTRSQKASSISFSRKAVS